MALLTWSDDFKVKVESIDEQHKIMLRMLNRLHDAMTNGEGVQKVDNILDDFIVFAEHHFESEEVTMRQMDYPFIDEHIAEHQDLLVAIRNYRKMNKTHVPLSMATLENFLMSWTRRHMIDADRKYGEFVAHH
ncbi:MAG: bacteriohemerythrin [Candidatus Zixiibacteriota bacterium]